MRQSLSFDFVTKNKNVQPISDGDRKQPHFAFGEGGSNFPNLRRSAIISTSVSTHEVAFE